MTGLHYLARSSSNQSDPHLDERLIDLLVAAGGDVNAVDAQTRPGKIVVHPFKAPWFLTCSTCSTCFIFHFFIFNRWGWSSVRASSLRPEEKPGFGKEEVAASDAFDVFRCLSMSFNVFQCLSMSFDAS